EIRRNLRDIAFDAAGTYRHLRHLRGRRWTLALDFFVPLARHIGIFAHAGEFNARGFTDIDDVYRSTDKIPENREVNCHEARTNNDCEWKPDAVAQDDY